jgi:hypothetical protein
VSRVAITLDEHALAELARRANAAKEPVARTAARLVRDGLLSTPTTTTAPSTDAPAAERQRSTSGAPASPGWLEPVDQREQWRRELWASVSALAQRYPRVLSKLIEGWWEDRGLVEVLAALAAWRSELDAGLNPDPRAELLFHDRLEILDRQLTHASDPTAARFSGGAPPSDWVGA